MAFPNTSVLDTFTRTNSTGLGANWTANAVGDANGMDIVSNAAVPHTAAFASDGWNVTTYGPDSEVYVTVATAGTSSECDLYARVSTISSGTFDGYHMACSHNTNNVVLTRIDAGVASAALATFAQAIANGDSVGMSIIGTTITAWYKAGAGAWTSLGTATDSTYGAAGYLVLEAGNNTWTFTNFGGGTALGGLPQTSKMNLVYLRRNR